MICFWVDFERQNKYNNLQENLLRWVNFEDEYVYVSIPNRNSIEEGFN